MSHKKVLITGAAGFLGSHLMLHHLKLGDTVLGIDNFCSSESDSDHVKMIQLLCSMPKHNSSALMVGDITENDESSLRSCVEEFEIFSKKKSFDLIYNFACPASPPIYQEMPILTMMTCVVGTAAVLQLAEESGAVVVHASTSEIYGDPEHSPQNESYRGRVNSYGPRACYDEGKRAAEALCFDYLNSYNVDVRVVRIFNTYGPNMDPYDGRVVSNFICQALRGEKLTLFGGGEQTRSFCYVDDLIHAIVAMGELSKNPGAPINIGNPNEFKVKDLADLVLKKIRGVSGVGSLYLIDNKPMPVDDPTQRCPDITKANDLLGWEPKVQLSEGLDKTIAYFKQALNMKNI
jgi:UDP-glucuronate decarboxylase